MAVLKQAERRLKYWFNRRYPYWRICYHHWCFRGQTYDHRCHLHQDDP